MDRTVCLLIICMGFIFLFFYLRHNSDKKIIYYTNTQEKKHNK